MKNSTSFTGGNFDDVQALVRILGEGIIFS
jgi:hypothetical protein